MGRLVNYFPTITAFIAFILTLLCLFAGTQKAVIPGANIMTVLTSNSSENTGICDFYSIYVMSYCEGDLISGDRRITNCSSSSIFFSFDPSTVLLEESGNTTSLSNLGWPDAISDDFDAFSMTTRSMGVFYSIGAGVAGLAMLARGYLEARRGPRQTVLELSALLIGFTMLGISSIIATVIAFQFVNLVNSHGEDSGVKAEYGSQFLGMTWAAAGMFLMGSVTSLMMVLFDRGRSEEDGPADDPPEEEAKSLVHSEDDYDSGNPSVKGHDD
ncbi:hypothetical protein BO70DRAFT_297197 [Aspergillus heteromorphus CBS 117.55]|uniref:Actin cortical patch SUR7/pH-response regulator PalI n=1 Tax=Aspergillus heteromorphus CBS 117.55 TaxID=1448321 RepID=A0A317VNZ8_9EURO|nr:uncharacterized protein BO70DRAFT_297197 [Aspergillus heteromorphus CBS 117.55]PWY73650.1 hypothetical protein BO70DRAFT_297197 [Aspergillus heteromorphus CBS 117.55]